MCHGKSFFMGIRSNILGLVMFSSFLSFTVLSGLLYWPLPGLRVAYDARTRPIWGSGRSTSYLKVFEILIVFLGRVSVRERTIELWVSEKRNP